MILLCLVLIYLTEQQDPKRRSQSRLQKPGPLKLAHCPFHLIKQTLCEQLLCITKETKQQRTIAVCSRIDTNPVPLVPPKLTCLLPPFLQTPDSHLAPKGRINYLEQTTLGFFSVLKRGKRLHFLSSRQHPNLSPLSHRAQDKNL